MRCREFLACILVAGCALAKPPPPAPPRHALLGLAIKTVTLANGLRVVLVKDPHASEVQVTMRYQVGSADDLEHPGIAHLVEHLMFQQTLGSQTLFAHLEDNATFFNAFTTFDGTTYVSRARPDFLAKLLSIEAVRLGFRCTSITDSAFERERKVVMQELKLKSEAFDLWDSLLRAVYPANHAYAGARDSVKTVSEITRGEACAFADAYYAPSNAALVISGNLTNEQVEVALGKFLARVAKRVTSSPGPVAAVTKPMPHVATAPIDSKALLVACAVPHDPGDRIALMPLFKEAIGAVNDAVKGRVRGCDRARRCAGADRRRRRRSDRGRSQYEVYSITSRTCSSNSPTSSRSTCQPSRSRRSGSGRSTSALPRSRTAATATFALLSTCSPDEIRRRRYRPSCARCAI